MNIQVMYPHGKDTRATSFNSSFSIRAFCIKARNKNSIACNAPAHTNLKTKSRFDDLVKKNFDTKI